MKMAFLAVACESFARLLDSFHVVAPICLELIRSSFFAPIATTFILHHPADSAASMARSSEPHLPIFSSTRIVNILLHHLSHPVVPPRQLHPLIPPTRHRLTPINTVVSEDQKPESTSLKSTDLRLAKRLKVDHEWDG